VLQNIRGQHSRKAAAATQKLAQHITQYGIKLKNSKVQKPDIPLYASKLCSINKITQREEEK
jgi:hypothetical protein